MYRTTKCMAAWAAVILGLSALACGSGGGGGDPAPELTLQEKCERKCVVLEDPGDDADIKRRNPCAGETPPDNCVNRCVEAVDIAADLGEGERCTDCVLRTTGWWGERIVKKTAGPFDTKTACNSHQYRGDSTGGSTDINFSRCVEEVRCDGFVFPEPGDGTFCGVECGYEFLESPQPADMGGIDASMPPPDVGTD